jgi:hypothetical protein
MDAISLEEVRISLEEANEKPRFRDKLLELWYKLLEPWLHAVVMVNDFAAHAAAAAAMLVAVKLLALLFESLWPLGFVAFEGTSIEVSVETIFKNSEITIFVVYCAYAVVRGVKRCFGK